MQDHLPTVIILAAGRGERFAASGGKGSKLDALLAGKRVLDHVLDTVRDSGLPHHLVLPDASRPGMGDSIAAGVRACAGAPGWMILPGDLALVSAASLRAVATASASGAVVPRFEMRAGHPVRFPAGCGPDLMALGGTKGAAPVLRRQAAAGAVTFLDLQDCGIVTDIDTTEDLLRANALLARRRIIV